MKINNQIIEINPEAKFTYINQVTKEKWIEWKKWNELNEEEKQKVNLGMVSNKYIILDKDFENLNNEQILEEWKKFKEKLIKNNDNYYLVDRSPRGFHVFLPFEDLDNLDEDVQSEIRNIIIKQYECDLAKKSMKGVIALPQKPHFKTNKIYDIIENCLNGENKLGKALIFQAKEKAKKKKEKSNIKVDIDFKDYFEKDNFFNYIKSNIIQDDTHRNDVIFPNLAIACAKTGKDAQEIENIIKPIIENNFPGKVYAEFEGWLKKDG